MSTSRRSQRARGRRRDGDASRRRRANGSTVWASAPGRRRLPPRNPDAPKNWPPPSSAWRRETRWAAVQGHGDPCVRLAGPGGACMTIDYRDARAGRRCQRSTLCSARVSATHSPTFTSPRTWLPSSTTSRPRRGPSEIADRRFAFRLAEDGRRGSSASSSSGPLELPVETDAAGRSSCARSTSSRSGTGRALRRR